MQAVIMAGGKGTRLLPLTGDVIPKPLADIAGKPILEWQIKKLKEQGVNDIVLVIGHLGHKIQEYFGSGEKFGVDIEYIEEKVPLGSAGSFSMLDPLIKGDDFFLAFGDVLFDIDIQRMFEFHKIKKALVTLFVHPNAHPYDSDLVVCDEDQEITRFDSKNNKRDYWYHNCVNAGLYWMKREICAYMPQNTKMDLAAEFIPKLKAAGHKISAYKSPEYVKDVGTVERIKTAAEEWAGGYAKSRNLKHSQRAIFLDRDGTINKRNGLVYKEEQFELEEGVSEAVRIINASGCLAIVVTNQPVVARGLCDMEDVGNIHAKMETLLGREGAYLDGIYFCPHHPDKGYPEENPKYKIPCRCRKPDTGMIEEAVKAFNIDLSKSWIIGDSTADIQTGINAGIKTALVMTGDAGKDGKYNAKPDITAVNLLEAVKMIIGGA